jgi:uncharacterized membrane protein YidH (DUF202 family)
VLINSKKETEQKMYYTTSGAYRKSKMLIDYATIALTAVIMILFILILFLRSNSGILFPIVFLAGALINGLSGIKAFMNKKRLSGVFLIIAAVILLIVSAAVGLAVL